MLSATQIKEAEIEPGISEPDSTEALRKIIATQQERNVEYGEAEEMSEALIIFFETLADNMG